MLCNFLRIDLHFIHQIMFKKKKKNCVCVCVKYIKCKIVSVKEGTS